MHRRAFVAGVALWCGGCTSRIPVLGGDEGTPAGGTPSATDTATPVGSPTASATPTPPDAAVTPRNWLSTPADDPDAGGRVEYFEPSALFGYEERLAGKFVADLTRTRDYERMSGVEFGTLDAAVSTGRAHVLAGTFDLVDVEGALNLDLLAEDGTYRGFRVWVAAADAPFPGWAVGVAPERLVFAPPSGDVDPRAALERAIDVGVGDGPRYAAADDALARLLDELGTTHWVVGRRRADPPDGTPVPPSSAGAVADGFRVTVTGGETTLRIVLVYADEDAADVAAVEDVLADREHAAVPWSLVENPSVGRDGRVVAIEDVVPTESLHR